MNWIKRGLIFAPDKSLWWSQRYAMMPTPVFLEQENIIRVFLGTTDEERFGRCTYIDLDADDPTTVVKYPNNFLADLGRIGTFDDSGAIPSSIVAANNNFFLYYVGFQRAVRVPYMLFSGLMTSPDMQNFSRYSEAPIMDRNKENVFSNAAPFVLFDKEEEIFKMWFWLGREWISLNEKLYITAEIRYTSSKDGYNWTDASQLCIVPDIGLKEFSVGRPWVIKDERGYKMFYSVRYTDKLYRLGYAESQDGISWTRKDSEVGIDIDEHGWDSEMICYPAILQVKGKTLLFYNGNNNGETGFGLAELETNS